MTEIPLDVLINGATLQIRHADHEPTIQRYVDSFENLPPIDVFDTPDGLFVVDGFQRLAAARRLGKKRIAANVHAGTREGAAEFAIVANTRSGYPLTIEERNDGIRRLRQLHPDWLPARIAEAMSVSPETVRRVLRADEVRRQVGSTAARNLPDSHVNEVAKADPGDHAALLAAADDRRWSRDVTRLAVQNLRDERIAPERKRALLAGEADPVVVTPDGQLAVPADVVGKRLRELREHDAYLQMERALEQLARLRLWTPEDIATALDRPRMERLVKELPGYVDFLNDLLHATEQETRKLAVV